MEKSPFNVRLKLKREKKRQFDLDLPNSNAEQFSHLQASKPVNLFGGFRCSLHLARAVDE